MPVIIMTAYSDLDSAVSAFQGGAFEYLPKPFDLSQAIELIRRAVNENDVARRAGRSGAGRRRTCSARRRRCRRCSAPSAGCRQSSVTVLVTGESGTGKELIARALHRHSARSAKPFVALNMAAIPRDLLESELFGHERGSFTGAQQQRRGRFEQADGGTLFLDEIGDMPAEMQTRLLRVLSEGHYYRVGGHQAIKSNVRVIAATHQNLEERARQGLFREDLFHRLNVIRLRLPPLRDRVEDIPLLARHFLARSAADLGVETKRLAPDAVEWLAAGGMARQRPAAGERLQLADGDGAGADDFGPRPAAGDTRRARARARYPPPARLRRGRRPRPPALPLRRRGADFGNAQPATAGAVSAITLEGFLGADEVQPAGAGAAGAARGDFMVGTDADGRAAPVGDPLDGSGASAGAPRRSGCAAGVGGTPRPRSGPPACRRQRRGRDRCRCRKQAEPFGVMARLTRVFEATMIRAALKHTRGRRVEAAQRLGIGRNTITRKIQELGLDD